MLRINGIDRVALAMLLARYGLELTLVAPQEVIPGSYWGDSEAGLIGHRIHARLDTPLHSVLHEAAHSICMTPERRAGLDTDAGGDDAGGVRRVLSAGAAGRCAAGGRAASGCSATWTSGATASGWAAQQPGSNQDADDARAWLVKHGVLDAQCRVTYANR